MNLYVETVEKRFWRSDMLHVGAIFEQLASRNDSESERERQITMVFEDVSFHEYARCRAADDTIVSNILHSMELYPNNKAIQCSGAGILWKVSLYSQEFKDKIVFLDGVRIVLECLKRYVQCQDCCLHGCWLISSLAYKSYTRCELIAQYKGIEIVIDALKVHKERFDVLEAGFSVLKNVSLKRELAGVDTSEMVIASEESQRRMLIDSSGGVVMLLDAIRKHGEKKVIVKQAMSALCYLCIGEEDIFEKVTEQGGVIELLNIKEIHSANKTLSRQCHLLLGHILNNSNLLLQVLKVHPEHPAVLTYFYEMIARNLETDKFDGEWRNQVLVYQNFTVYDMIGIQYGMQVLQTVEVVLSKPRVGTAVPADEILTTGVSM
eukprot:638005-Hanusia_phi.AAC.1